MTKMHGGDWDDDRLDAAFAARAAATPSTPVDIDEVLRRRVATQARVPARWPWLAAAAAFVALLVVVGGSSLLVSPQPSPTLPAAAASGPPPTASGQPPALTPAPRPTIDVLAALGDPLSVSEAIEVRTSEIRMQEIVVQGYLSPVPDFVRCRAESGIVNPTMLECPLDMQWLMEDAEQLVTSGASAPGVRPPAGPAFNASFALVEAPIVPMFPEDGVTPVPLVLIGHFNDRRATACDQRQRCLEIFIVDRVVEVDGVPMPIQTDDRAARAPADPESDVDGLVATLAPKAPILSRQLVTAAQARALEPVLERDQIVPYIDQTKLAWLVTTVDLTDIPYARTFMLLDGSSWFAEITRSGAIMHERAAPQPTRGTILGPSAEPDAFASAPFSVAGIRVEGVSDITEELRSEESRIVREVHAIRGWYIAPRPGVTCDPALRLLHAPTPPCDEARHWLLLDPQLYGVEPGQLRRDPVAVPNILNPLLPVDVPFDVGETWRGDVPVPQPVVVLGHFNDTRVMGYRSDEYLVIDALAWSRTDRPLDRVTRLTAAATEDPSAVAARIHAVSEQEPLATWLTAMDAPDFAVVESDNASRYLDEFTSGPPVWSVRRLVFRGGEFVIDTGHTADHGTRVWFAPNLSSDSDLMTSIDLHDLDTNTDLVQVFDYDQVVVAVGPADGRSGLSWVEAGPVEGLYEVAPGRNDREVVVRWRDPECATSYRLDVEDYGNGAIRLDPEPLGPACQGDGVWRRLVIEFDRPVDIDRFRTGDPCCG